MIERYTKPEMKAIWSADNRFRKWLDIEIAACQAHAELGNIPKDALAEIEQKAEFDTQRIHEIEAEVNHDVIAFLTSVAEKVGPASRFIHLGLTSTDIVDTGLSLLLKDAGNQLLQGIDKLLTALKKQAMAHQYTLIMGRTHGVHAEPLTFGLKTTVWYEEMKRNQTRLKDALETLRVGKISGAVGNYAHIPPVLEEMICKKLGLKTAEVSTQTLQRDRHAQFVTTCAIIGGTLEKMAVEIRLLQKTESNEAMEPFGKGQKGSSAMPHKRNPILCERVTGLSRTLRGYCVTALEDQALWHERDISHSSAERVILPDTTATLDYMLSLMGTIIENLVVQPEEMEANIKKSYQIFFSQPLLLKLVEKGLTREDAYRIVQRNALAAFDQKVQFNDKIREDKDITAHLSEKEITEVFSYDRYTRHIQEIYDKVYKK